MQLDWYDRRVLTYLLDSCDTAMPSDDEALVSVGLNCARLLRRVDAVIDCVATQDVSFVEPDMTLVRRAACRRRDSVRSGAAG